MTIIVDRRMSAVEMLAAHARKSPQSCAMCKGAFEGREYRLAMADSRRFCSPRCKQKHYRLRRKLARLQEQVAAIEAQLG